MELDTLVSLLGETELLREQYETARALQAQRRKNELIVSVLGQFKRGKSSVINAILGEPLLPTGILPLTTVVTELRYAPSFRAQVCFTDGTARPIPPEALPAYCSEQENPGNRKNVQSVQLWSPRQPFGEGIVLADTPGVGSVHQHNTDCSYAWAEKSDVILFLLSMDSPVSETERHFLQKARPYAARFFFAVNKADTVSPEDKEAFFSFCQGVLSDIMGSAVSLTAVSARTGEGLSALTAAISRELTASRGTLLDTSAEKKAEILAGQARAKLSLVLQASSLSRQALTEKLERIETEKASLTDFGEELRVLAEHRTKRLTEALDGRLRAQAQELS